MPKKSKSKTSAALKMRELRKSRKEKGLLNVCVVVPADQVVTVHQFAADLCKKASIRVTDDLFGYGVNYRASNALDERSEDGVQDDP